MLILYLAGAASARAAPPAATEQPLALPHPKNLQVLPKNISEAELGRVMKQFRTDLGVTCGYCHVEDPVTQKLNYALDDKPAKRTARLMIVMLNEINNKYLAQLGDRRYSVPVTCGSCHQGESTPPAFDPQ